MRFNFNRWSRKLHRWAAVVCCLPLLVVIVTGLFLLLKKDVAWIQPPTLRGSSSVPEIGFADILEVARRVPEADVESWEDIDRLDVRPEKGVVKVRCKNRWEVQIDLASSRVLLVKFRRSDLIESLHDGSWFHDYAKLLIFLPNGIILLGLWVTGAWLWYLPYHSRSKRRRRLRKQTGETDL